MVSCDAGSSLTSQRSYRIHAQSPRYTKLSYILRRVSLQRTSATLRMKDPHLTYLKLDDMNSLKIAFMVEVKVSAVRLLSPHREAYLQSLEVCHVIINKVETGRRGVSTAR